MHIEVVGGVKVTDICIFMIKLLNVIPTTCDFSKQYDYLYEPSSLAAPMLLGPGINEARKRANQFEIKHWQLSDYSSRPPSILKKSADCVSFTQFQKNGFNI